MKLNGFSKKLLILTGAFLFSNGAFAETAALNMRVHDLLDGFLSYEKSSLEIGTSTSPDKIVPWGQGDVGDSSIEIVSIDGKTRKQLLYVYQEGKNDDNTVHDAGAYGGAKVVISNTLENGVDCEQGPRQFQTAFIAVEEGQLLCIKTRSGDRYAVVQVLKIGANGIRLGVLAGAQSSAQFAPGLRQGQ
jgi:hypothetical protein